MASVVDYGSLALMDVVIHAIPSIRRRERQDTDGPELSDVPVELTPAGRRYLTERLAQALLKSRPVTEMKSPVSPVPDHVRTLAADVSTLVPASREMAVHLFGVESGRNSSGLLMVATTTLSAEPAIVVTKIEHEQGVQVQMEIHDDGRRGFNLTYLDNLIFAQTTKVYKVAAFPVATAQQGSRLLGGAADPQNGQGISEVWLHDFLGCEFVERPEVLTERFYEGISKAANVVLATDPTQAAQVEIALLAEMNKSSRTIEPQRFITENIEARYQDAFAQALLSAGVSMASVPKDTSTITGKIRRIKIDTHRDATVLVPPAMYDDGSVQISDGDDGQSRIVVQDKVRKITGASGAKEA